MIKLRLSSPQYLSFYFDLFSCPPLSSQGKPFFYSGVYWKRTYDALHPSGPKGWFSLAHKHKHNHKHKHKHKHMCKQVKTGST